jgi:RimJ/RimL family protein N-acetyltransferase
MILGNKIRLRAIEREDIPFFVEWLNDEEVRHNLMLYIPMSMDMEEGWFNGLAQAPMAERPLGIEVLTEERWKLIGNTSFMHIDWKDRSAEVGIFIGDKSFWSKGNGQKAMRLMVRHGFKNLNLNRIYLQVYATNPRAVRCYENSGFIHEGRLRQAHHQDGQYVDILMMSVLRSEWKEEE